MSLLKVRNVTAGYGDNTVLKGVTFSVNSGQFWALIGPNGSGKTTLLRLIVGEIEPHNGEITLSGRSLSQWSRREIARIIGYLPQNINADNFLRVREYISLGFYHRIGPFRELREAEEMEMEHIMAITDTASLADKPLGQLSMGQLQRVRFARILIQKPALILLDEPMAHLDPGFSLEFLELIKNESRRGSAVIAVFHNIEFVPLYATHVLLLRDGHHEAGEVHEIMQPERIKSVFGIDIAYCMGRIVILPPQERREQWKNRSYSATKANNS